MYNIDDYDLKILTLLQANGRLTNQELSDLIGLSGRMASASVAPRGPAWPSWMPIFAALFACTKSVRRLQAVTCASVWMPGQRGVMRPSPETAVISVITSPAPPVARAP